MKRVFPDYAYSDAPRDGCWWDETVPALDWPELQGDTKVDVAVVGGGFTGVSAALHLAEAASVAVFEAGPPGWGASGRNGGFCCLGGSKLSSAMMERRYGRAAAQAYAAAEEDAVNLVAALLDQHGIAADRHSSGETQLAHSNHAMDVLRRNQDEMGVLHDAADLPGLGLGGPFLGGYTHPVGFGLNPRKYLFGLAKAAEALGVRLFQNSPVQRIDKTASGFALKTHTGQVHAEIVLICTNGYSSEDIPDWMSGRYMPAQSTVMVTRPLSQAEQMAQGWTSDQMCYDTRNLLHYFRLMPDGRFLFGMRGGLRSSVQTEASIRAKVQQDFKKMFPAWSQVEATHLWSGLVCMSRALTPYVGPIPEQPGMYAGFAYHGNGVAMGTYCGRALARLALGQNAGLPTLMRQTPQRFPMGRWRRAIMPPAYALMALADLR
ncbi:FAD-dependent oxidoreductase [Ruegeria sp. HKCCD5849]|uniref:NAD(P)/FAD-dependent oxidoreductase n=1 Tax=unclassified Ruegeria TaxID=2625375 RepID=UPI001490BA83|nr:MULTISPECIES: FAD-binding oxidoreductase [unclassified Ruegeria]NOD49223.1 FAD-dependent oxidoreductase [Ruegeria sp. HKCCD5849]NOD51787.1 FAD-dependent oxidoreductase [Ruegeria sp. HKCCD5851]